MCFEFRRDTKISGLFMYKNQKAVLESDLFSKKWSRSNKSIRLSKANCTCFFVLKITEIALLSILSSCCKFHFPCGTKIFVEGQKMLVFLFIIENTIYVKWKLCSFFERSVSKTQFKIEYLAQQPAM